MVDAGSSRDRRHAIDWLSAYYSITSSAVILHRNKELEQREMKLQIGALLFVCGGAAAFMQQPLRTAAPGKTGILMSSDDVDIKDRRSFVTKVRLLRDEVIDLLDLRKCRSCG